MRAAFLVLAHKNPDRIDALARQLTADGVSEAFVHVDAKAPAAVHAGIARGPRVTVLEDRVPVVWGDISQVDATLRLLRAALACGRPFDWVVLLSGQDLMVRDGLGAFLDADPKALHLEARRIEDGDPQTNAWRVRWPKVTRNLYDSPWHPYRLLRAGLRKLFVWGIEPLRNPRSLPEGWTFHRGSQWWAVPAEAARWMIGFVDANPSYRETLAASLTPDEFFFHTAWMNSPFAGRSRGKNLTFLNFGKTYRDNNHPVPLTMADVPAIEASGRYFARKFEPTVDAAVIERFSGPRKA